MLEIDIYRSVETSRSVTGHFSTGGKLICYELEPARTTPVHEGHPCIPAGRYRVIRTLSPHLGYKSPEVLNVPGRTAIRWHIGNGPKDVLGCSAVGDALATDWVYNSKETFNGVLMPLLNKVWDAGEEIWATYHDPVVA